MYSLLTAMKNTEKPAKKRSSLDKFKGDISSMFKAGFDENFIWQWASQNCGKYRVSLEKARYIVLAPITGRKV